LARIHFLDGRTWNNWVVWSVSDKDETCSILKKSAHSEGNWKAEDFKRIWPENQEYLRFYNKGKD
jgi:endoglucanase